MPKNFTVIREDLMDRYFCIRDQITNLESKLNHNFELDKPIYQEINVKIKELQQIVLDLESLNKEYKSSRD